MIIFETQEDCWNWLMSNLSQTEMRALYHEAYSILKNKEDASDALREALLKGATKCHQLRNKNRLFQWMYTITRNVAYSMYNKNRLQSIYIQAKIHLERSGWAESAEAHLMTAFEKEQLRQAIEKLKYPGKEILIMHIFQNMSFKVIANALNMNCNSVRSTYHRNLVLLKDELEDNHNV